MFGRSKKNKNGNVSVSVSVVVEAVYACRIDSTGGYSRNEAVALYDEQFRRLGNGRLGDYQDILVDAGRLQALAGNTGRLMTEDEMESGISNGPARHAVGEFGKYIAYVE